MRKLKKYSRQNIVADQHGYHVVYIPLTAKVILFPLRFAKKNGLRDLEYVTLPRTGALEVALKVLGKDGKASNGNANSKSELRVRSIGKQGDHQGCKGTTV